MGGVTARGIIAAVAPGDAFAEHVSHSGAFGGPSERVLTFIQLGSRGNY